MSCLFTILLLASSLSFGQGAIEFDEDLANEQISEDLEIGAYVGTIKARDTNDEDAVFVYGIYDLSSSPDAYDYLEVDGASGNVTIKADIDYESFTSMSAQWLANAIKSPVVTLYITNENDNAPIFQDEPYSKEISENEPVNSTVATVTATDADPRDTIIYSLSNSGANCEMEDFRVESTSGEIIVAKKLDYASVVQYTVCVKAADQGGLEDTTTVVISIRDAQNQPPVFIGQPYDKTIPENTAVGHVVLTVVANDGDLGVNPRNTINYTLIDDADGTFSVRTNGEIVVEKELDRETEPITQLYTLIVQAIEDDNSDQSFAQINTNTSIYIRLSDVNDNIPTFNQDGPIGTTIPERSPPGTQLDFGLEAFDLDSGDSGKIALSLEDDEDVFYLASDTIFNSGVVDIRVDNSSALDFERISNFTFQIRASDSETLNSSVITAVVYLTNINDNTPTFSTDQYDVALPENSPEGTFVIQLKATDADIDSVLEYELLGYNNEWFAIDRSYGNITVSADAEFDAELLSVYFLTCVVSDGDRVSTALLNVTVTDMNDEAPDFQSEDYSVTIPEYNLDDLEQQELQILQVVATDADSNEVNRILTYSIESGNEDGKFDIDSASGMIFRNASIDRESEAATYELLVMATDSGSPPLNGTTDVIITIEDVNDNDPLFLEDVYNATVAENAASGTEVANVTAVDADVDSLAVLYIIEGASPFLVNQEGIITLGGTVDYEVQMMYNLTVTATDREDTSRQDSCQVLIAIVDVNDERPVFDTPSPSSLSVNESDTFCDSPTGSDNCTVLITLNASDPDTNADLSFSISTVKGYDENNGMVEDDFSSQFGVVSGTGEVFVRTKLDRETVQRFDVTVGVKDLNATGDDADYQTDSAELVITVLDVNDNPPKFIELPDNFTTPETDQVGMVISVDILANDIDAGNNGMVMYGLLDDADGRVRIDPDTGILSVNSPIDREMSDSLTIIFYVKDKGDPPLNTTKTRQIFITDVNDETPVFNETLPSEANVPEDVANETWVLTVHATDKDSDFGELTYSISAGVGAEDFEIDNKTGEITVQKELDRERQSVYTLTVVASDGTRQDNLEVTINILDVNDNSPVFTDSFPESTSISETAEPGSSVAAIIATDDDEPGTNNSAVRYSMINHNQTDFFKINYETGVVTLNTSTTDSLIPGDYVLEVTAFDLGDPRLESDPKDFWVEVTDYNDEAPVFVNPTQGSIVYVNEGYSGYITTAEATDGDLGDNGVVTFAFDTSLGATKDYIYFTINNITGEINIVETTDRETKETYILGIIGMNARSDPIRTSQVTFSVQVNDANDNEPAYWGKGTGPNGPQEPPEPLQLEVQENLEDGTFVGTVPTAIDLDSDPSFTQIFYFIVEGTNEDYFYLDEVSGNLTLLRPIDREVRPQFSLVIKAVSDPEFVPQENIPYNPLSDGTLARVTVLVTDVNDSPPRFDADRYTAGVLFSTPFGVEIITVNATDPDVGSNAVVEYEILSQTSYGFDTDGNLKTSPVNVFGINSFGQVINSVIFQDSVDSYYIVELQATDSQNGDFKDNATLSVYLMTETDQVSAIFADEPGNIRDRQNEFKQLLEEIMEEVGGYDDVSVNIDSLDFELDGNSLPIPNRTEMLLHVVDDIENIVISPATVQEVIDDAYGYTEELLSFHLIEVEFKTKQVEPDVLTALQTASFALAFVLFLILVLLSVVFYLSVTSYKRQIRAATIDLYRAGEKKEPPAPGTNMFAESKNPIYNPMATEVKEPLSDEDEAGKEAKESLQPKEEEYQEVELSFDVEPHYEDVGEGNDKLLDDVLDKYEKQAHVNLGFDQGESNSQNLYISDV
ncbi:cadherin-23-like [Lytechinus variegatus]|uniref:cadherin-23-like n=1 Tax=Lytechinus variegatus TaxID=7654 RepID=UPI001BB28EAB|nr:cadherin-23-like [Lytechinus variegatus]